MQEMRDLVDELSGYAYQYYVLDEPTISDAQYDALYDRLVALEAELQTKLPDSPTGRVGGAPVSAFAPHTHLRRLWSLDKAQTPEQLSTWLARTSKNLKALSLPDPAYALEYKFDGLTLCLTYQNGQLIEAATRGNGVVGEAILEQVKTIRSIPLTIPCPNLCEIQCEGIMRLSTLEKYNRTAQEPLKNARNAAAGALRNLDPKVTATRRLDAFAYQVNYIEGRGFSDHAQMMAFLRENRFPISPYLRYLPDDVDAILEALAEIDEKRPTLDYLIDGAVLKLTDFASREALGNTDKFPRWMVAYKFEAEEQTSTLLDVTWEVGRTGKLTPLAHIEPVELAGATVSRATLNNLGDIRRKNVAVGCTVWVRRSNDVIPEILGRVGEPSESELEIEAPESCPACAARIESRGAHLFCPGGLNCPPQAIGRLTHYASRDAMDIETFNDKTAALLYETRGVRQPADLYDLTAESFQGLPGFAQKRTEKLLEAIAASRSRPLDAFLHALGIPNVGRKTARDLAVRFGSVSALRAATLEALVTIPEVGEIVAASILEFFADPVAADGVARLQRAGVDPVMDAPAKKPQSALTGKKFVLTGTLPTLTRAEATARIEAAGGQVVGSVSKKTDYVVAGEDAGSKFEKARTLGLPILDEAGLRALLEENDHATGQADQ